MTPRDLRVAVPLTAFLTVLGVPLGLLAAALTPHLASGFYYGPGQTLYRSAVDAEDPAVFGGDGVLLAILVGVGVLLGVLAFVFGRRVPIGTVVGVLAGGCLAGLVAMAVHHQVLEPSYRHAAAGSVHSLRPYVRGRADAAFLPMAALLVWSLLNVPWWWRHRAPEPPAPVSWGTADSG